MVDFTDLPENQSFLGRGSALVPVGSHTCQIARLLHRSPAYADSTTKQYPPDTCGGRRFPCKSGFWNALAHFIGTKDVPKLPTVHSYYPHTLDIRIAAYICKSLPQMQLVVILMITSS